MIATESTERVPLDPVLVALNCAPNVTSLMFAYVHAVPQRSLDVPSVIVVSAPVGGEPPQTLAVPASDADNTSPIVSVPNAVPTSLCLITWAWMPKMNWPAGIENPYPVPRKSWVSAAVLQVAYTASVSVILPGLDHAVVPVAMFAPVAGRSCVPDGVGMGAPLCFGGQGCATPWPTAINGRLARLPERPD